MYMRGTIYIISFAPQLIINIEQCMRKYFFVFQAIKTMLRTKCNPTHSFPMKRMLQATLISSLVFASSCGNKSSESDIRQELPVMTVVSAPVEIKESYSASIQGRQDIEIYPQVSGTISRLCVQEGQKVRKGEPLFIIDQVPYQAALRKATANVHSAQAQVETARMEYDSKRKLFQEKIVSDYDLSTAKNALAVAEAGLELAKAEEIDARNSLSYTEVKSPADGVVGTLPYRMGALVSPSITQPLTTVSDNSQMYVYFSMSENQLRNHLRQYGSPDEVIRQMPPIELQLNDGSVYNEKGNIESISGVIDRQTGTVSIRSVFPNKNKLLLSGGIGNVIIPHKEDAAIVIPQNATYEIQDKIYACKVNKEGKVSVMELAVEKLNNGKDYIVRSGLSADDVIVTEGVGLLRDGMEINIKADVTQP